MTDLDGDLPPESQLLGTKSLRLWNAFLIFFLIVLVVGGLLMPIPFHGPAVDPLADLAHAPLFCALSLGAMGLFSFFFPGRAAAPVGRLANAIFRGMAVIVLLAVFGIAVEFLQRNVGRNASWGDVFANIVGSCAGVLAYWGLEGRRRGWRRWLTLGLLLASAWLILWISYEPAIAVWKAMVGA